MVRKSYGKMRGGRKKLKLRKKLSVTPYMRQFEEGQKVHISIISSSRFPHPKFQGMTGTVCSRSGRTYVVEVREGNALKKVYLRPEHLVPAGKQDASKQ